MLPVDLLDYVSFLPPAPNPKSKTDNSSAKLDGVATEGIDTNNEIQHYSSSKAAFDSYVNPVEIEATHKLIGLWHGSFTMKNPKGNQEVEETFFFHSIAGQGTHPKLSELPSEPYPTLFKPKVLNPPIGIRSLVSDSSQNEGTPCSQDMDDDRPDETHLVGFGKNAYGRFSLYGVYNMKTDTFKCEKRYVTSKYKGLKRGRKPLSSYTQNPADNEEQHRMTTRPRAASAPKVLDPVDTLPQQQPTNKKSRKSMSVSVGRSSSHDTSMDEVCNVVHTATPQLCREVILKIAFQLVFFDRVTMFPRRLHQRHHQFRLRAHVVIVIQ